MASGIAIAYAAAGSGVNLASGFVTLDLCFISAMPLAVTLVPLIVLFIIPSPIIVTCNL